MLQTVESGNLLFRPFLESDILPLYRIQSDPVAMKHTICTSSYEATEKILRTYAGSEEQNGFAPWTIVFHPENRVIGWGGLNVDPFDPGWGVEVAYFFNPAYWGRGFATELVRISLKEGFGRYELSEIHAFAKKENAASIRVLEKNGFRFLGLEERIARNHYLVSSEK